MKVNKNLKFAMIVAGMITGARVSYNLFPTNPFFMIAGAFIAGGLVTVASILAEE